LLALLLGIYRAGLFTADNTFPMIRQVWQAVMPSSTHATDEKPTLTTIPQSYNGPGDYQPVTAYGGVKIYY